MNKILNKYLLVLGLFSLLPMVVSGQSLKDRITDCYKYLIKNNDLTLDIDVKAWKRGREDRPIDQTNFIYINDKEGFYMKTLDIEVIQNNDLTIRLDHSLKEVSIISSPNNKSIDPDDMGLPTWLMNMENIDSVYTIDVQRKKNEEIYTLKQGGYKEMVINIRNNQITKLIQYPPQQVSYKGKSITTVVEMDYSYKPAQKRLRFNDVIDKSFAEVRLKNKYAKYKMIDRRDLEKSEKK